MSRRGAAAVMAIGIAICPAIAAADPPTRPDPDPWWGPDKALHFGASALITGGAYGLGTFVSPRLEGRVVFAASIGITAGLMKEVADAAGLGTPSWKDFAWDLLGTGVAIGISVSIDAATRSF